MKYTIIGAGIGGLTTALAFEQKGIDYELYERASELKEVGAGIWLAPNALQVFDKLNVLDEVQKAGNRMYQMTIGKKDMSSISDANLKKIEEKFGYTTVAIHRAKLQQILFDKIPSNKVHLGKSFSQYEIQNDQTLKVHFEDQSTCESDFLIGADGINSKVRKQLFPTSQIRYTGQTCWRGVSNLELPSDLHHRGFELWGDQLRFGFSRISKGKVYWFAVALAPENEKEDATQLKSNLLERYQSYDALVKDLIQATPDDKIIRNDINDLAPMKNWYKDQICLIGDAGHATTPNMGQGGAQAIEDAHYLSSIISKYTMKKAFTLFQEKRQKKVNQIVNKSWMIGKMGHWKYGTGLRNFIMKTTPSKVMLNQLIETYTIEMKV